MKGPIGALSLVFAASLGSVMIPVAGRLTDRFGRVRVYRAFALFELASASPIWWSLSQGSTVVTIVVMSAGLGIAAGGCSAPAAPSSPSCSVRGVVTSGSR